MSNASLKRIIFYYLAFITTLIHAANVYCVRHDYTFLHNNVISTCKTYTKSKTIAEAVATTNTSSTTRAQLTFDLTCLADDSQCDGVRATFQKASDLLNDVFQLQHGVTINATYLSFCKVLGDCVDSDNMIYAGQAVPSVSYVMLDSSDNITRMYPQALLKQFTNLSVKPNWDQYDIDAQFNTEINWYFANNPNPIGKDQTDFLRTVLHELMHGLGFITSWSDELYTSFARLIDNLDRFITPALLAATSDNQVIGDTDEPQPFWGFVEYPLDKLIYYDNSGNLQSFTSHTQELNKWSDSNALFNRTIDMANSWYSSSSFTDAKALYQSVTTALDVLAVVNKERTLWLETSLNPFSEGSSLCHVDLSQYINSTEYLMVYSANEGVSVDQLDQVYPQGPLGPKLLSVMAGMGYLIDSKYTSNASTTRIQTYQPPINYWSPPNGLVQTNSNPSPSLTVNTDGPAHYPSSTSTLLTESKVPSSSSSLILPFFRMNILCITFIIYLN